MRPVWRTANAILPLVTGPVGPGREEYCNNSVEVTGERREKNNNTERRKALKKKNTRIRPKCQPHAGAWRYEGPRRRTRSGGDGTPPVRHPPPWRTGLVDRRIPARCRCDRGTKTTGTFGLKCCQPKRGRPSRHRLFHDNCNNYRFAVSGRRWPIPPVRVTSPMWPQVVCCRYFLYGIIRRERDATIRVDEIF